MQTIINGNFLIDFHGMAFICVFRISTAISTTLILFSSPYGPSLHNLRHNIFGLTADVGDGSGHEGGGSELPAITHEPSTTSVTGGGNT